MSTAQTRPLRSVTVRSVGTGYYFFELIGGRGEPLESGWGDDEGRLRIKPERVFVASGANIHYPEITLNSYDTEPPPSESPFALEVWGTWKVRMSKRVTVWSSDSYPADEKPLKLPASSNDEYLMRVSAGHQDIGNQDLDDYVYEYNEQHDEAPVGLEHFVIDFWPAPKPASS